MKYTNEQIEELSEQAVLEIIKENETLKKQLEVAVNLLKKIVCFCDMECTESLAEIKRIGGGE